MQQQPTLLKPSDLTKPLLKTPSNYYENEGSKDGSLKVSPSAVRAIPVLRGEEKALDHPALLYDSSLRTSPRVEHRPAFSIDSPPINLVVSQDEWLPMPCGGENDSLLEEQTIKQENRPDGGFQEVPDVLKQLILSDSKLRQNEKVLKKFEEHRSIAEQFCAHDHVGFEANDNMSNEVVKENGSSRKSDSSLDQMIKSESVTVKNRKDSMERLDCSCLTPNGSTTHIETADHEETPCESKKEESSMDISTSKPSYTSQESDTSNDAAIAAALQEELRKEENKNQPSKCRIPQEGATPRTEYTHDFELALKIQEGYDEEMANIIQSEENEEPFHVAVDSRQRYANHPENQGYVLQSGASRFQQSDRELDRERRLRYLERENQRRVAFSGCGPQVAESDSIGLSYEELYELEDVSHGYDNSVIERYTSTFQFTNEISRPHSESEHKKCFICLTEYDVGDLLRLLPCMHSFHCTCIDTWLGGKKSCPVCLRDLI